MAPEFELDIEQGADFDNTLQWFGGGKFIAPIEHISVGYPTIITVTGHSLNSVSPTPVIISGVDGCKDLNSMETGIEPATRIDDNKFQVAVSTVADVWVEGTGELTYFMPTNLTGYTAVCQIRKNWYAKTIIHEMTTENGGIILGPLDGSCRLLIPAAITADFCFTGAVYDVDLRAPGGFITRVFRGPVTMYPEISK